MNDCLLESENFQITKSDNTGKYLLLPVKKTQQQQAEKFVLKECGKDINSMTEIVFFPHLLKNTYTQTLNLISFFFEIKFVKKKSKNYLPQNFHHSTLSHTNTLNVPLFLSVQGKTHFVLSMLQFFGRDHESKSSNKKNFHSILLC